MAVNIVTNNWPSTSIYDNLYIPPPPAKHCRCGVCLRRRGLGVAPGRLPAPPELRIAPEPERALTGRRVLALRDYARRRAPPELRPAPKYHPTDYGCAQQ